MNLEMQTVLMTTLNAPYQTHLDAGALAAAIKTNDVSTGQIASFFSETAVDMQKAFAEDFGISSDQLTQAAQSFAHWSGQTVALLE